MDIQRLKRDIIANRYLTLIFLLSTFIFLYQHNKNLSWDFSAYVLNAKYLFYQGAYFETLRPPIASLILGIFLFFGNVGKYFYIVFVSMLFIFANIKLSDACFTNLALNKKFKLKKETIRLLFYFFSMSTFALLYSTSSGTELLGLAFFELFLAMLITGRISGAYLALAFLSRYSFLIFIPFMLINKKLKIVIWNFIIFFLVVLPWLIFNYLRFGNPFVSIIDSYANNILFRQTLMQAFDLSHVLIATNWFTLLSISGIIILGIFLISKKIKQFTDHKTAFIFLTITLIFLLDYNNIPLKQARYLFNLTLPVAFFSSFFIFFILLKFEKINWEKYERQIKVLFVVLFIINFSIVLAQVNATKNYDDKFYSAASDIKNLNLENCEILSPHWVLITYFTENVYPLGRNDLYSSLKQGKIILIFTGEETIDDNFDFLELKKYNSLYETEEYIFLARENLTKDDCSKKYVFDDTYVNNHCQIFGDLFKRVDLNQFTEKICSLFQK